MEKPLNIGPKPKKAVDGIEGVRSVGNRIEARAEK